MIPSQTAKEKAAEIRKLIWSQPPQVIAELSEFFSMEDESPDKDADINEMVNNFFYYHGYEAGFTKYEKQRVCCYMSLPDVLIDIESQTDEDGDGEHIWRFSE